MQNMTQIALLVMAGVLAGICSGLFGIGGGIVLVPFLVYVLGYSQVTASGTSLVALLLPVGLLGVLAYYQSGKIGPENIKAGLIIALGLFAGAYVGARIAIGLPELVLRRAFAVLIVFAAVKLWGVF